MASTEPIARLARQAGQHVDGLRAAGVQAVPRRRRAAPGAADTRSRLHELAKAVASCTRCPLYQDATQAVVSDGSPAARLMFIGEAPGRDEDLQGKPFVGAAGQLLTKMIVAMGLRREDVYICNIVKHRPPGNRQPLPEEQAACFPFLEEQIRLVAPKVMCTLGSVATKALLGPDISITRIRGKVHEYRGILVVPTFHPAYLLRNPPAKKDCWEDLKRVNKLLEHADA